MGGMYLHPRVYRWLMENVGKEQMKLYEAESAPVNAVAASGTLTFSDSVSDGETVTIGDDVYEFDTDSDVAEGHIAVDVSGGATASDAVTALVAAITDNATEGVSAVDGDGDTVVVTADTKGTAGNAIATTTTCVDGSWAEETLTGGVAGTVGEQWTLFVDASYLYVCVADNGVTGANWRRVALGSAY